MMKATELWSSALPLPETENIVSSLVDGFYHLVASTPNYTFAEKETALTKQLTLYLQNTQAMGLATGFWDFEVNTDTKNLSDPRRLDIRFITVVDNTKKVTLIFECKKMGTPKSTTATKHCNSYINEGIARFVTGSYAPTESLGFLVAFLELKTSTAMQSLKAALNNSVTQTKLGMVKHSTGEFIVEPPERFQKHALFSTEHTRQMSHATSPISTIALYHIPLVF